MKLLFGDYLTMLLLAKGTSMYPTLLDGCVYTLRKVECDKICKGNVIAFKLDDMYICHRVIKVIETRSGKIFYKTQGDNCEDADSFVVTPKMIVGIVEDV